MIPFAYYATAAKTAGVPSMWIDDAAQDIAIRVWAAGDPPFWKTVVHYAAIDAARRYGADNRARHRPTVEPLPPDLTAPDPYPALEAVIDFGRAWTALTAKQQAALTRIVNGCPDRSGDRVWRARRNLRRLTAA